MGFNIKFGLGHEGCGLMCNIRHTRTGYVRHVFEQSEQLKANVWRQRHDAMRSSEKRFQ